MKSGLFVNDYVFILQLGDELPREYPQLATLFGALDITLVPIRLQDLLDIKKDKNIFHVITIVNDLRTRSIFLNLQKKVLNFYLKSRRFHLHHISSFGKIDIYPQIARLNVYKHYHVPLDLKLVTYQIAMNYHQTGKQLQIWPGGKRAKLPV